MSEKLWCSTSKEKRKCTDYIERHEGLQNITDRLIDLTSNRPDSILIRENYYTFGRYFIIVNDIKGNWNDISPLSSREYIIKKKKSIIDTEISYTIRISANPYSIYLLVENDFVDLLTVGNGAYSMYIWNIISLLNDISNEISMEQ